MKDLIQIKNAILSDPKMKFILLIFAFISLALISNYAFATDVLAGTDGDVKDTMDATGKHWIYWIDGALSIGAFFYSKKVTVFFSVLALCLFVTVLGKLAAPSV